MKKIITVILAVYLTGCSNAVYTTACDSAYTLLEDKQYSNTIIVLNICLATIANDHPKRSRYYAIRAGAFDGLAQYDEAIKDQEKVIELNEGANIHDYVNYALFLRKAENYTKALEAIKHVESHNIEEGIVEMSTQYHMGWIYHDMGEHELAIEAYNKGIPEQIDYAFVYWRRALSFSALGEDELAKKDLGTFKKIHEENKMALPKYVIDLVSEVFAKYDYPTDFFYSYRSD